MKQKPLIIVYTLLFALASLNADDSNFNKNTIKIEIPNQLVIGQSNKLNVSYALPTGYYTTEENLFIKLTSIQKNVKLGKVDILSPVVDGKHSGLLNFTQEIIILKDIDTKELYLDASYQLCDVDGVCFLPKSIKLDPLAIDLVTPIIKWQDLVWFLLLAYIGGLLLNFMPCVLPVVMLKIYAVLSLQNKVERLGYMLSYSAGLIITSLALALVLILLRSLGYSMGFGFHWQNGYFVLAMFLFLFIIILNLLDIVPLKIGFIGGKNSSALFQGVLTFLLSTPCSAPLLGLAMFWVIDKPIIVLILAFTLIGLGLLTPFWILPLLPKKWHDVFTRQRYLASFLKYATLLSLALVLRWLLSFLLPQLHLGYFLGGIIGFSLACYLFGKSLYRFKWLALVILLASSYSLYSSYETNNNAIVKIEKPWQAYSASKVDLDLAEGRPVFISFGALWCISCRYNDYMVLQNKDLLSFFKDNKVALYKIDLTYSTSPEANDLLDKIGRNSLPSYALYDKNGKLGSMGNLITKNKIISYYQ